MHAGSAGVFFVGCLCDQPLVAAFRFRCAVCNRAPYTQTNPLIRAKNPATIGLDLNWVSPNLDELCYGTITTCFRFDLQAGGKCRPRARSCCLLHSFQCKSTCWPNHIAIFFIDVRFHIGIGSLAGPVMREHVPDHGCRGLEQANLFAGKALVFSNCIQLLCDFTGKFGSFRFCRSSRCGKFRELEPLPPCNRSTGTLVGQPSISWNRSERTTSLDLAAAPLLPLHASCTPSCRYSSSVN